MHAHRSGLPPVAEHMDFNQAYLMVAIFREGPLLKEKKRPFDRAAGATTPCSILVGITPSLPGQLTQAVYLATQPLTPQVSSADGVHIRILDMVQIDHAHVEVAKHLVLAATGHAIDDDAEHDDLEFELFTKLVGRIAISIEGTVHPLKVYRQESVAVSIVIKCWTSPATSPLHGKIHYESKCLAENPSLQFCRVGQFLVVQAGNAAISVWSFPDHRAVFHVV